MAVARGRPTSPHPLLNLGGPLARIVSLSLSLSLFVRGPSISKATSCVHATYIGREDGQLMLASGERVFMGELPQVALI